MRYLRTKNAHKQLARTSLTDQYVTHNVENEGAINSTVRLFVPGGLYKEPLGMERTPWNWLGGRVGRSKVKNLLWEVMDFFL